jgi:stage V sporulation protein B
VAALPLFTAKFSGGDKIGLTKRAESVFSVTLFFAAPMGLCFALFSEQILSLLFNDTSAAIAAPQLMLLSPAIVFLPLVTVLNTVLEATGRPHLPLFALTLGAAVKFAVSFFLLGNVDFGIAGAPIGTSVGYGFSLIISYAFSSWISGVDCINMRKCIKIIMVSLTSVFGAKGVFILISKEISALPGLMISMIILAVIYVVLSMLVKIFAMFGGKISAK